MAWSIRRCWPRPKSSVTEIYRIGGAQAVAALAFGTDTIAPVDKIVGPGNAYVAAAKRQVFGTVGIDMIAGPSEVLVIADESANPAFIAADLLAQTEHGAGAQGVAVVTTQKLADEVAAEVERQLALLPRAELTREGWEEYGADHHRRHARDGARYRQPHGARASRTVGRRPDGSARPA